MIQTMPLAIDEGQRLERLHGLAVLDSAPEPMFDSFARIASEACRTPIALVTFVDRERVWFKSNLGLAGRSEARREAMFCSQTILSEGVMVVPDLLCDSRFAKLPLVTGDPGLRFYAGAPITMADGERLGAICVMNLVPGNLDDSQRAVLTELAMGVSHALSMRQRSLERGLSITSRFASSLLDGERTLRRVVDVQPAAISAWGLDCRLRFANRTHRNWFGAAPEAQFDRFISTVLDGGDATSTGSLLDAIRAGQHQRFEGRVLAPLGEVTRVRIELISDAEPTAGDRGWVCTISEVSKEGPSEIAPLAERLADTATNESDVDLHNLFEATPAMVQSTDETGRLISVSDKWLEKLGYSRWEVIGRRSVEFLTPAFRQKATGVIVPQSFRMGSVNDLACQMERKDGSIIDVVTSAVSLFDKQGRFQQSVAVMEDVTARKMAEEGLLASAIALGESEARLRLVVDNIPALVAYIDCEQRYRFTNRSYGLWYGIAGDAILGRTVREIIGDENHGRFEPAILKALSGEPVQREGWVTGQDGARWANVTLLPHRDDSDCVLGAYVFIVDRTATRQAQLKLIESEQRLQTIIANVPALIGYWGQDGRCIFGNRAYADWFGIEPDNLPGLSPVELLGERLYALSQEHFAAALRGGRRQLS